MEVQQDGFPPQAYGESVERRTSGYEHWFSLLYPLNSITFHLKAVKS
jgi:hypothetical protein